MKIVKIMGGLGNQMFQYAFAYSLFNEINEEIKLDTSFFNSVLDDTRVTMHNCELEKFNINPVYATDEEIQKCLKRKKSNLLKLLNKRVVVKENDKRLNNLNSFKSVENAYFEGYFQSEKYFAKFRDDILEKFTLKEPLDFQNQQMLDKINMANAVSLHIRRGDYMNLQNIYKICDVEYYSKAIKYIAENVENPHFFLFSDDVEWVVKNLKLEYSYTVVDFNKGAGYLDMELMKNCKHNITANSTFSWWGAWLNKNEQKIVITPQKWFNDKKLQKNILSIIPNDWIKL